MKERSYNNLEFDPYDYYKVYLKPKVNEEAKTLFDNLIKKSNTNIDLNNNLTKQVRALSEEINDKTSKLSLFKGLKTFLIILCIVGVVLAAIGIFNIIKGYELVYLLLIIIGVLVFIASLLIVTLVLNKKIKEITGENNKLKDKYNKAYKECYNTLNDFKATLNFKQYVNFVNNLDTVITLDEEVDRKKIKLFQNEFNCNFDFGENQTIVDIYSGTIANNPFIRVLLTDEQLLDHTYSGSRVVSWTETYRDSKGRMCTRTRTETLVAHYTAKAPNYYTNSMVIYGNGAAPNLTFTRYPSGLKLNHDEKDIKEIVKDRSKKLEEITEKAIKEGKTFTKLANEEFDSLFYAVDRDNEVEYRLLFTPLAQQNLVELITATDTYGDDFSFYKDKKINYVSSYHGSLGITFNYSHFYSYAFYDLLEQDYIKMLTDSFYSLYFELAPILAIPLYQMNEAPLIEDGTLKEEITLTEAEAFVNHMDKTLFRHPKTNTKQILKLKRIENFKNADLFDVTSYSYQTINRIAVVPVAAMNGRVYNVDVPWIEYIPVRMNNKVAITKIKEENVSNMESEGNNIYRYHNFLATFVGDKEYSNSDDDIFAKAIKSRYNIYK